MVKNITVRIEEELHLKLKCIAEYEKRSVNSQIITVVKKLVADFERENGKIKDIG